MNNFTVASIYKRNKHIRGGTCILIRNNIKYEEIQNLDKYNIEMVFEVCGLEIRDRNLIVLCIYRSPKENVDIFLNQLQLVLNNLGNSINKKKIIICADFNIDILKDSSDKLKLTFLLQTFNIQFTVLEPTRIMGQSSTAIDNIACNFLDHNIRIFDPGLSDHKAQIMQLNLKNNNIYENCCHMTARRIYSKDSLENYCNALKSINWDCINDTNSIHENC